TPPSASRLPLPEDLWCGSTPRGGAGTRRMGSASARRPAEVWRANRPLKSWEPSRQHSLSALGASPTPAGIWSGRSTPTLTATRRSVPQRQSAHSPRWNPKQPCSPYRAPNGQRGVTMSNLTCSGSPFGACRIRVTKLQGLGFPLPGAGNAYVTDAPIEVAFKKTKTAGATFKQNDGCGNLKVSIRLPDQ